MELDLHTRKHENEDEYKNEIKRKKKSAEFV